MRKEYDFENMKGRKNPYAKNINHAKRKRLYFIPQREFVDKGLTRFFTGIHTITTIGTLGQAPASYAFGVQI